LSKVSRSKELGDKIDAMSIGIFPAFEALNDVRVIQVEPSLDIRNDTVKLVIAQAAVLSRDLAPGDIDANLTVKSLVTRLEFATPHELPIAIIPLLWVSFENVILSNAFRSSVFACLCRVCHAVLLC